MLLDLCFQRNACADVQVQLGGDSASSKEEWISGLLSAEPAGGITTLNVFTADCNKIIWYWNFLDVGTSQYEVKGFNLFTLTSELKISQLNLEFNSIAWGLDTGEKLTLRNGTQVP